MKIEDEIKSTVELDIAKKVLLNVMYTQNFVNDKFNEILKPYDLSGEQYNVLRILKGQKGCPTNMCSIQDRMVAKSSNTTRLIDKLLLKDYVTREVCPNNRRKIEVLITQKGLDILYKLDPIVMEHDDVNDWDKEFYVTQPDFNMLDLEGIYQTKLTVVSATQLTGTLTVNVSLSVSGSNTALSGVLPADFTLVDASGTTVTVDSAAESPSGTYTIVATDDATTGTLALGVSTIGTANYQSLAVAFETA